jgi:hypothetical protein
MNMVDTLHTGKKWWLLTHGHLLCILGFFLVVVLPVVFTFFFTKISVSFAAICLIIAVPFVVFVMIVSGYAYRNLHAVVDRLPQGWGLEDFDPVRYTTTVKNEAQKFIQCYYEPLHILGVFEKFDCVQMGNGT